MAKAKKSSKKTAKKSSAVKRPAAKKSAGRTERFQASASQDTFTGSSYQTENPSATAETSPGGVSTIVKVAVAVILVISFYFIYRSFTTRQDAPSTTATEAVKPGIKPGVVQTREYTIARGDTLITIAKNRLGNANRQAEILALNPGLKAEQIKPGLKIKLPVK